jgi:hypothetical protein
MTKVTINPPKTPVTKGSNGVAAATLPNICKMPPPPPPFVPTPLPNVGQSGEQPSGYSITVKIEGQPVAIRGASFGSRGDLASRGTGGGVISNNAEGPTKFLGPGAFDVHIEGKSVHLLSDSTLNNCGPSGSPANSATMAGLIQSPLVATETPTTACTGSQHVWEAQEAPDTPTLDRKIRDGKAARSQGARFEAAAAEHNKNSGELKRTSQLSGSGKAKIWWICSVCGFKREGDQLHDGPQPGSAPVAVEVKSKPVLSDKDLRQLGRNCQAVGQGGASGLIYKLPASGSEAAIAQLRNAEKIMNCVIKIVKI